MKIAIGSNDKQTINPRHFGESKFYMIFEILNGEIKSEELRENPFHVEGKAEHGKTKQVMEFLDDCDLFMGKTIGKKALEQLADNNIEVITTKIKDIQQAIEYYLIGKDDYFKFYNKDKRSMTPCTDRD